MNRDKEILEDLLCEQMPSTLAEVADCILDSGWLAEHDRDIAEESWDQGYKAWVTKAKQQEIVLGASRPRITATNPYRKE